MYIEIAESKGHPGFLVEFNVNGINGVNVGTHLVGDLAVILNAS